MKPIGVSILRKSHRELQRKQRKIIINTNCKKTADEICSKFVRV